MSEPQGNHRTIDARLEKVHGHGVSQAVNSDTLVRQRRAHRGSRHAMLGQQVLHAMDAETCTLGTGEQHVTAASWRFTQPGFHHGEGGSGEGDAALLAPLADDADVSAGSEDEVLACESGHLGYAQTRLDAHQEKSVIA